MRIFTYFDCTPGLPDQGELIRQWRDSWQARGWDCRILSQRTYVGHKLWPDFRRAIRSMDPVKKARLSRWLALDAVGGGWICHYDVINFGPAGYFPVLNKQRRSVVFDIEFSYAHLTKADCHRVVKHICDGAENETHAFYDTLAPVDLYQKHHAQFGQSGWDEAHTVHFSHDACQGGLNWIPRGLSCPKFKHAESCGRTF